MRNPERALLVDAWGLNPSPVRVEGDTVAFEVGQHDLVQLCVEFT